MKACDVADLVSAQYPPSLDTRKVGLELEFPVVTPDGRGVPFEVMAALFTGLGQLGWQVTRDRDTDAPVAAARPTAGPSSLDSFGPDVVTVEFGAHTMEVVLAPTDDVAAAGHSLEAVLAAVIPILRRHGAVLIGYGVQPVTPPVAANVAPRGRYRLLQRCWIPGPQDQYDIHLLTLSASSQAHVDVTRDEVVPVVNALNLTTGLRVALLANSAVWNGRISDHAAPRELFWNWCYSARANQVGIPPRFTSILDYVQHVLGFQGLLTRRGDQVYQVDNRTTVGSYLANEVNVVRTVEGEPVQLVPTLEDVAVGWGLAWFDARMQPAYGTAEERCTCQQPPSATLAPAALTLGLVENLDGLCRLARSLPIRQWREIRELACRHGLAARHPDVDLPAMVRQLLDAAHVGLLRRARGEEKFLEVLYERMSLGRHPGVDAEAWLSSGGPASLVQHTDMSRFIGQPVAPRSGCGPDR